MELDPLTLKLLIKDIPPLSDVPVSEIVIKKITGLTNHNYLLETSAEQYILRIPRQSTNKNINRVNEAHNTKIAYQLGLTPEILWREKEAGSYTGMSVVVAVEGASPLATEDYKNEKILENIAQSLKALQSSQQLFKGQLSEKEIAQYLKKYFLLCTKTQQKSLKDKLNKSLELLAIIKKVDRPSVCSHIDLVTENFIKVNTEIRLIDWEYSAMASPFWDIATLCNEAKFNDEQAHLFLSKVMSDSRDDDFECLQKYRSIVKTISHFWTTAYIT